MEVAFPIEDLLKKGLTPDEFTICILLNKELYDLLEEFAALKGDHFFNNIKKLANLEYINYNTIGSIIDIKNIKITDRFKSLISFDDPFKELYDLYPSTILRPDGKKDYLRRNKNKCKIKYIKILDKDPMIHNHIVKCLKYELEDKKRRGSMGYVKRLENWLEQREWENYEEELNNMSNVIPQKKKNITTYGAELL